MKVQGRAHKKKVEQKMELTTCEAKNDETMKVRKDEATVFSQGKKQLSPKK